MHPRTIIVMGVSGVGKTSVALGLTAHFDGIYIEADDLHPPENVKAMSEGTPLTDEMRAPWLKSVAQAIADEHRKVKDRTVVATCSALKRQYRDVIRATLPDAHFVFLTADKDLITSRMSAREGHYMPVSLLESQLATLEPLAEDEAHTEVDVSGTPDEVTSRAIKTLSS
ncbi:MAG: gluconokinase [Cognatishimia sp.]|uniref:gluconokinase n=1 Tax=Cognatishimia sp. TaxID=2211648 RepID=UPI003B8B4260